MAAPHHSSGVVPLPRIDDAAPAKRVKGKLQLAQCLHLAGPHGADVLDLETIRQRKLRNIRSDEEDPAAKLDTSRSAASWHKKDGQSGHAPGSAGAHTPSTRTTHFYNGAKGISMSQAGSWLDARTFDHKDATEPVPSARRRAARRGCLSESERYMLKRCKDVLMRRYGTLSNAFKKLDQSEAGSLPMSDFVEATKGILKPAEAQILFRLLDVHEEGVSLSDLHQQLGDLA